jgi:imidazole glycerol phosphate synthase glutamine amidotransferase subunit
VLDYGAGNLRSAQRALERAGATVTVTEDAATASHADALVVPGVGHFGQCVRQFVAAGLRQLVDDWVAAAKPLLGICVGMQIMYPASDESPGEVGLGLLPGTVRRLPESVTVPHMGWNTVAPVGDDPLLDGIAGEYVYFVHSYAAVPSDAGHVVATCDYGPGFPAVVRVGSVVGTQFHPEKSGDVGARLLANWLREVRT